MTMGKKIGIVSRIIDRLSIRQPRIHTGAVFLEHGGLY
jgi:hypothetical protein